MYSRFVLAALTLAFVPSGAQLPDPPVEAEWASSEGALVEGQRHGPWVHRSDDGTVAEGAYTNGTRTGLWLFRFPGGGVLEGGYVDGERHGVWSTTSTDTNRSEYYLNGIDADNALRAIDDVESLMEFMETSGIGVDDMVFSYMRSSILHAAVDLGKPVEIIRALLDLGAAPNLEGLQFGDTPMSLAVPSDRCTDHDLSVFDALADAGGDVTQGRHRSGGTALHTFANVYPCSDRLATAFVDRMTAPGLPVDARDEYGRTPLNEAAGQESSISVFRALIEAGADVNSADRYGQTPLHNLVLGPIREQELERVITGLEAERYEGNRAGRLSDIGLLLLRNGADPNLRNRDGRTPLDGIDEDSWFGDTPLYRELVRQTVSGN